MTLKTLSLTCLSIVAVANIGCRSPALDYAQQNHGLYESLGRTKPNQSAALFVLSDEVKRSLPKDKIAIFIRAQVDLDLILSKQKPLYCSLGMQFDDGGTNVYSCSEYVITEWAELRTIHGLRCTRKGISIKFNSNFLNDNRPFDDISHTWIEFRAQ